MRGRVRGQVIGDHLDQHRCRSKVPDLIHRVICQPIATGFHPGMKSHLTAGDKSLPSGFGNIVYQLRINSKPQPVHRAVIAQHIHRSHITNAHPQAIVLGFGWHANVAVARRHHMHFSGGRVLPVRHRVAHRNGAGEGCARFHAQQMVINERHHHGAAVGHRYRLHDEHPATRIKVVVERGHERRPTGRQQRQVILCHRRCVAVCRHHINTNHAGGG